MLKDAPEVPDVAYARQASLGRVEFELLEPHDRTEGLEHAVHCATMSIVTQYWQPRNVRPLETSLA